MKQKQRVFSLFLLSPSSRRAWIEIRPGVIANSIKLVALLAEGVDRNPYTLAGEEPGLSRPPRGGRG